MKIQNTVWAGAAAAALLLGGCVTQATQPAAPAATPPSTTPSTAAAPSLAATAGSVLGNVLQANGGAAALMANLGVPTTASASNAAGVLTYCAQRNLLQPDAAGALANQLLSSLGLPTATAATTPAATQDTGYVQGLAGLIVAPTGELFALDTIKGNVKDKACAFVLDGAKRLL